MQVDQYASRTKESPTDLEDKMCDLPKTGAVSPK